MDETRFVRGVRVVAVAACLSLLCLTAINTSSIATRDVPSPAPIAMEARDEITLVFAGNGWARMEIIASEHLNLAFHLEHAQINDLCNSTDDGEGIYDQGKLTSVHLFAEDDSPLHRFTWVGSPYWAGSPRQSGSCGTSDRVALEPGESALFVVADTAGGYKARLTASDEPSRLLPDRTMALGPHPGYLDIDLRQQAAQTSGTATPMAELEYREAADFDVSLQEGTAMFARWTHQGSAPVPVHVGAGGFRRDFSLLGPANGTFVMNHQEAGPYSLIGYSSDSLALASTWLRTAGNHQAHYWVYHTGIGASNALDHGARFIMVPTDPPPQL